MPIVFQHTVKGLLLFILCCCFGHSLFYSVKLKTVINTLRNREYNLSTLAEVKPETLLTSHNPLKFYFMIYFVLVADIVTRWKDLHLLANNASPNHNITEESPNYQHWVHINTNPALNFPYLFFLTLHSAYNGSIAERRTRGSRLWSIFLVILSFQIKGWFVFKLTKSSNGPRQRANTLKWLSRSICVMGQSSECVCVCACPMW